MGLIKSAIAPTTAQAFSMKDIENTARAVLVRARGQAEQLIAAAQAEGEVLKQQARDAGMAEGRADGLKKGRDEGLKAGKEQALKEHKAQIAGLAATLTKIIAELDASRRDLESRAVHDVISLSLTIAERVTKRQGVLDPAVAVANVSEALKLVSHASDVRIAIHPTQRASLEEVLPQLQLQWPKLAHVELIDDPAMAAGGCRIYTAQGEVDGDLDEQLRRLAVELLPGPEGSAS